MPEAPDRLPSEVYYDYECIKWAWENARTLQEGRWPGAKPSNWIEPNVYVTRGIKRGVFEMPAIIFAEISMRAKKCWPDCDLVEARYIQGLTDRQMQGTFHQPLDIINRRINKVMWYSASGHNQRPESYEVWKRQQGSSRKYRAAVK